MALFRLRFKLNSPFLCNRRLYSTNDTNDYTHFGFQNVKETEKQARVNEVFRNVANRYDLMNDAMSFGVHRLWKDNFVASASPRVGMVCLDVAGGTGDIAARLVKHARYFGAKAGVPIQQASNSTVSSESPSPLIQTTEVPDSVFTAPPDSPLTTPAPPPKIDQKMIDDFVSSAPDISPDIDELWIKQATKGNIPTPRPEPPADFSHSIPIAPSNSHIITPSELDDSFDHHVLQDATVSNVGSTIQDQSPTPIANPYDISVTVCDISVEMMAVGQERMKGMGYENAIQWVHGNAEELPFADNTFDLYTIAFGIRNCTHVQQVLNEAFRVLKPYGRFMCLEFSEVPNPLLRTVYDEYSFQVIPVMGQILAADWDSYQYLVESIRRFPNQKKFADMLRQAGLRCVQYQNYSFGVAAVHSGLKLPS